MTRAGRAPAALVIAWCAVAGACRSRPATPPAAPITFSEPIVELRAEIGQRQSHDVRLAGTAAARAHLAIEAVEDAALQVQVLPAGGAAPPGLRLAFSGDRAGTRSGQVIVATGIAEAPRLTLLYALIVPTKVHVVPSNPYFNLRDPGAQQRVLRVRGSQAGFRVLDARITEGPFKATVLRATGAEGEPYEASVQVTVAPEAIGGSDLRGFLGKLRLTTNDAAQPVVDVPLFAMGALAPRRDGAASTR